MVDGAGAGVAVSAGAGAGEAVSGAGVLLSAGAGVLMSGEGVFGAAADWAHAMPDTPRRAALPIRLPIRMIFFTMLSVLSIRTSVAQALPPPGQTGLRNEGFAQFFNRQRDEPIRRRIEAATPRTVKRASWG